jgi:predicted HAD superfamily Cof-like phosphohydrolase
MQKDSAIFMEAVGQIVSRTPAFTEENEAQAFLMKELIKEEFEELETAYAERDVVAVADACGDMVVCIMNLCNTLGINFPAVYHEIVRSNMTKIPDDGTVLRREDGKVMKPSTYVPPNISRAIGL